MKLEEFDCPSCGASLTVNEGKKTLSCPYCDSTVIVPEQLHPKEPVGSPRQPSRPVQPTVVIDPAHTTRTCSRAIVMILFSTLLVAGISLFVFTQLSPENVGELIDQTITHVTTATGGGVEEVRRFGGEGMSAGYFQSASCLCPGGNGSILVGDSESGRIQHFSPSGSYMEHWTLEGEDLYLSSMARSLDGDLYLVYDSEIYLHDPSTMERVGQLHHPEGWGFEDVEVTDDGKVVAAWYCNRDDIAVFNPDGSLDFLMEDAISGITGDSELTMDVEVDGEGNIYAYGSFNESFFKFDPEGNFQNRFGSSGDRPGQLTAPTAFCIDPRGRLWVSDFNRLKVYDGSGTFLDSFDPKMTFHDMYMADGYQLYGILSGNQVVQLDLSGAAGSL